MRVVLDTNILISACWKPTGLEAQTLEHAIAGSYSPVASKIIWAEYEEVLRRPKFRSIADKAEDLLARLAPRLTWVEPLIRLELAAEEDDNRFLECAAAAEADYLLTGNLKHYPAAIGPTRICSARHFLNEAQLSFVDSAVP